MTPSLRLWPGLTIVAIQWVLRYVAPLIDSELMPVAFGAGMLGSIGVLVWWLFFSRAPWMERIAGLLLIAGGLAATPPFLHQSIRGGMMSLMFYLYVAPVLSLALVGWAYATRNIAGAGNRLATMALAIAAACSTLTVLRTDGTMGTGSQLAWRWTPDAEQRLLTSTPPPPVPAQPPPTPTQPATPAAPAAAKVTQPAPVITPPPPAPRIDWSGFRGARRDGAAPGVRIQADWTASPPAAVWKRPIGPGWSSFAVQGDRIYTQEQRGEFEMVSCYRLSTGEPVWAHRTKTRFWESNAGAGPRGTPTLAGGRVYAFGATGVLVALDAASGAPLWNRNVSADTGVKTPDWGFSSSPLVVDGLVVVAASGRVAAYDQNRGGEPRWIGDKVGGSYGSPHLLTVDGANQVLLLTGQGAVAFSPPDGKVLWKHEWDGSAILQPAVLADGNLLITTGGMSGGAGVRRIALSQNAGAWTTQERWTSTGLKPYYSDLVVHDGHAYGFDGSILSCIDLADGKRKWKGGRYGQGQMILLPDQDTLLVISEEGELALVAATPDGYREVARVPGIEGKTWNHPAVADGLLLVRNGEQMAAFRLQNPLPASSTNSADSQSRSAAMRTAP